MNLVNASRFSPAVDALGASRTGADARVLQLVSLLGLIVVRRWGT